MALCPDHCGLSIKPGRTYAGPGHNMRTPEGKRQASEMGKIGGRKGARRMHELYPTLASATMRRTWQLHPEMAEDNRSPERRRLIAEANRRPERRRQSRATMKAVHEKHPEIVENLLKQEHGSPTQPENRIFSLVMYHDLPYDFVGDDRSPRYHIGHKFPDFISNSRSVVVEVADWHEKKYRGWKSRKQYEEFCKSNYEPLRYSCLVIWYDSDDTQIVAVLKEASS